MILGKIPSLLHNLIMWACLFNPPHVYHPWYKSTLEIRVLLKQSTQCFFGWGIFTLWEYVVIDFLFVIKKITKKLGFLKRAKGRISTSSISIGYYFLFWRFFVNKSPLNTKFVLGCSPLWLHHKFWFKKTLQEIEGNYRIKVWNKIKVAYGTF